MIDIQGAPQIDIEAEPQIDLADYKRVVRKTPGELIFRVLGLNVTAVLAFYLFEDFVFVIQILIYNVVQAGFLVALLRAPDRVSRKRAMVVYGFATMVILNMLISVVYLWVMHGMEGKVMAVLFLMGIMLYSVSLRVFEPIQSRVEMVLVCICMSGLGVETLLMDPLTGAPIAMVIGLFGCLLYFILAATSTFGAHQKLEDAQRAELDHARMQAIGQLTGGVAHDFNNLLTVIQGNLELRRVIQRSGGSLVEAERLIREVEDAAERAAQSTRQLMAYSRKTHLAVTRVNPGVMLRDLEPFLARTLPASISMEVRIEPNLPWIKIDKAQIENVLLNLVINARDAMETRGGKIVIEVVQARPHGVTRSVEVSVQDTGVGIAPEILPRVTEPYFTTKAPGKGTGLGLSNARGIVEQLGGYISLASQPDVGTKVTLSFPTCESQHANTPAEAHEGQGPQKGSAVTLEGEAAYAQSERETLPS